MKDKQGNELTAKEFLGRWKQGIQQITPYQQSVINLIGVILVFIGVIVGVYATFKSRTWWLFIILVGSFLLTLVSLLSSYQRYSIFKKINKQKEEIKDEQKSTNGT